MVLRTEQTRKTVNLSLDSNETEVILGPEIGLETKQKYVYTLTAVNAIGNVTDGNIFRQLHNYSSCIINQRIMFIVTSDAQAVNVTVVDVSAIDIQCWFIHGSDALGCKVVLVSDYSNINNAQVHLSRNDTSASGQLHESNSQYFLLSESVCI